jgi:hypothetical protein
MKHYIPEKTDDRLSQLNEWFTQTLFSEDLFKDEKWLGIRLNLSKWKTLGFTFKQNSQPAELDFTIAEKLQIYTYFNNIAEVLLYAKEIRESATKQAFESAALYRDYHQSALQAITAKMEQEKPNFPFFKLDGNTLTLKNLDNYFIQQIVKERIRL